MARENWTGGVAQAVERLFCEHGPLSSYPSPTTKKREKERKEEGEKSTCDIFL
jgi:hypothetical protein